MTADRPMMLSHEVRQVTTFSQMHIDRLEKRGAFPRRFKISSEAKTGRVAWWRSEVEAWLKARGQKRQQQAASQQPQPDQAA